MTSRPPHLLFSACIALVLSVVLLARADGDDEGLVWGAVFAGVAILQGVRYLRQRGG